MLKKSARQFITVMTILAISQSPITAFAENRGKGNGKNEMTSTSASPNVGSITTSTWISPNFSKGPTTPAPTASYVNPGSSIALKFKLFNGGIELKSTQGVVVATVAAACVGVSPSPTPGNLGFATPGRSEKSKSNAYILKYNAGGFSTVWKTLKNATGCFQFRVSYPTGILNSPTFIFSAK